MHLHPNLYLGSAYTSRSFMWKRDFTFSVSGNFTSGLLTRTIICSTHTHTHTHAKGYPSKPGTVMSDALTEPTKTYRTTNKDAQQSHVLLCGWWPKESNRGHCFCFGAMRPRVRWLTVQTSTAQAKHVSHFRRFRVKGWVMYYLPQVSCYLNISRPWWGRRPGFLNRIFNSHQALDLST